MRLEGAAPLPFLAHARTSRGRSGSGEVPRRVKGGNAGAGIRNPLVVFDLILGHF